MSWSFQIALRVRALLFLSGLAIPGLLHAQASPSAYTTGYRYDMAGHLVGTISPDPDGGGPLHFAAVRNSYDAMGNLVRTETGELASWQPETIAPAAWSGFTVFHVEDDSYDAGGRKIRVTLSAGGSVQAVTQTSYDSDDETVCVVERMNPASFGSLPADACALSGQGSFGPDRITHTVYDNAGRVQKIQKAYGTPLAQDYETYSYTANGKIATITDANGNVATQTYDGFDRQLRWIFPSKTTVGSSDASDYEEYSYDASDNRLSLRKRDGRLINYQYDALGRMSAKDLAGAGRNVYYGYDNRGLQLAASFDAPGGEGILSNYDSLGRLVSSSTSLGGVTRTLSYQYDADGNRRQLSWPDGGYVAYDYDGLDRMIGIRENGATTIATISYDNQGRRSGLNQGAAATGYGYDGLSRLSSLTHDLAGTPGDVTIGLGYNPASQVVSQTRDNDAYAYTGELVVNRAYSVNGQNQYTAAGAASFGYDRNGNLTSDGSVSYAYDIENRLVSASGGRTANFVYDPQGRLWQTSGGSAGATTFLYDGDDLVAEYDGSGNVLRRYVHGPLADDPLVWYEGSALGGNRRFLFADQQGSLVSVADANGNLLSLNSYDEWGIPGAANSGRFQYTGQAWVPELGMYYYKARFYSPTLGRFLQTDPVGYKDQVNLYAYVANDPVNQEDPTGECTGSNISNSDGTCKGGGFVQGAGSCSGNCSPGVPTLRLSPAQMSSRTLDPGKVGGDPIGDTVITAGIGGGLSLGKGLIEAGIDAFGKNIVDAASSLEARAAALAERNGGNSVHLADGTSKMRVDLRGASHYSKELGRDVPTPHVQSYRGNVIPSGPRAGQIGSYTKSGDVQPATHGILDMVERYLSGIGL